MNSAADSRGSALQGGNSMAYAQWAVECQAEQYCRILLSHLQDAAPLTGHLNRSGRMLWKTTQPC